MSKKVLVAMSGGVDSSVAALLLMQAGHAVTGVTMCLGTLGRQERKVCCGMDAVEDARAVCDRIGIPHHVMDFSSVFRRTVIEKFIQEYGRGKTPNPCIDCNRFVKFGRLLAMARAMGFDYLATGHYAKIVQSQDGFCLMQAIDRDKDQTYFLYPILRKDLAHILFPLADYTKDRIRAIAGDALLPVAQKPESQDICFISENRYDRFLQETGHLILPGSIVDTQGRVLGKHAGIAFYTIGQRRGLGIAAKEPLYVLAIHAEKNELVVGAKADLKAYGLYATDFNALVEPLPNQAEAKIRYRKYPAKCAVSVEGERVRIDFNNPEEAVSPGQAVVLYKDGRVLGGGVIDEVLRRAG